MKKKNLICLARTILVIITTAFCSIAYAGEKEVCAGKQPESIESAISACKSLLNSTEPRWRPYLQSVIGGHYFSVDRYKEATPWLLLGANGGYSGDFFKLGVIEMQDGTCDTCLLKAIDYFERHIGADLKETGQADPVSLENLFKSKIWLGISQKDSKKLINLASELEGYSNQPKYLNSNIHGLLASLFANAPYIPNRDIRWRSLLERLNASKITCDQTYLLTLESCRSLRDLTLMRQARFGGQDMILDQQSYKSPPSEQISNELSKSKSALSPIAQIRNPKALETQHGLKLVSTTSFELPKSTDLFFDTSLVIASDHPIDAKEIDDRIKYLINSAKRFNNCGIGLRKIAVFQISAPSFSLGQAPGGGLPKRLEFGAQANSWIERNIPRELEKQNSEQSLGLVVVAYEGDGIFSPFATTNSPIPFVGIPSSQIKDRTGVINLAHEIGHAFSLNHPPTIEPNIMGYSAVTIENSLFDRFLPEQCEAMRSSPMLTPTHYLETKNLGQLSKKAQTDERLRQTFAFVRQNIKFQRLRFLGDTVSPPAIQSNKKVSIGACEIRAISKKFGISKTEAESIFIDAVYIPEGIEFNKGSPSSEKNKRDVFSFEEAYPNQFCRTWYVSDEGDWAMAALVRNFGDREVPNSFIESNKFPWPSTSRETDLEVGDIFESEMLEGRGYKILRYVPVDSRFADKEEKAYNAFLRQVVVVENDLFIIDQSGRRIIDVCRRCLPVFTGNWNTVETENNLPEQLTKSVSNLNQPIERRSPSSEMVEPKKGAVRVAAPGSALLNLYDVWRLLVREGKQGKPPLVLAASSINGNGYVPNTFDFSKFAAFGSFDDSIQSALREVLFKINVPKDRSIIIYDDRYDARDAYNLAQRIIREGYNNVYQMSDSLSDWRRVRLPMSRPLLPPP